MNAETLARWEQMACEIETHLSQQPVTAWEVAHAREATIVLRRAIHNEASKGALVRLTFHDAERGFVSLLGNEVTKREDGNVESILLDGIRVARRFETDLCGGHVIDEHGFHWTRISIDPVQS